MEPSRRKDTLDPLVGRLLGETYRIVRPIGRGGIGVVYEAEHVRLPKKVAVKMLRRELAENTEAFERFRREAQIACGIGSRHIAEVLDLNLMEDGSPYMVMELLHGEDLSARLVRRVRLPLPEALSIAGQVVAGLAATHRRGVVHRDLKPQNIFLCRTEERDDLVKLLDFGISKVLGGATHLTDSGVVMGTPHHMSPEQARGEIALVDQRTDVYALGVVLYQMLSGELPFRGDSTYAVLLKIVNDRPPPVRTYAPDVPPEVDAVVQRALAKEPAGRPASATALWDELLVATGATPRPPGLGTPGGGTDTMAHAPTQHAGETPKPSTALAWQSAEAPARTAVVPRALLAGGVVAAAVVLGSWAAFFRAPPAEAPAPLRAAAAPAAPDAPPAPPATVRVTLVVSPPDARLWLDGAPVAAGTHELPRGDAAHRLEARARGFEPQETTFVPGRDLTVRLELPPSPAPRARRRTPPRAEPRPAGPAAPRPPALVGGDEL